MMRGGLVGRQAEMQCVAAALAAARSGHGDAMFVTGEPGVGKTRLATEAIGVAADAGMVTARGRASTVGPVVPYRPLVEALLSLARAGLLSDLDELGRYGPVLARLLPEAHVTGVGTPSHIMVAEALLRLLAVVGRRRGCLLVLDDLHDADVETLAVVEYLLDNLAGQPVVLLAVARHEPDTAINLAARARQRNAVPTLELRPLSRSDVHLLVTAELGVEPGDVSAGLVDRVMADSAGVPFVVEELLHDLTHRARDVQKLSVPATVAHSFRRRAGRLGPRGRKILSVAALFGQRFPTRVLQQAVGCEEHELSTILHAGVASYLLERDGSGPDWYSFRHRLAVGVLLEDLGPGERAEYARRAVSVLDDLYPGLPGEWCARAAELCEHAGDDAEAVRLFCESGRRSIVAGDSDRAVTLLVRACQVAHTGIPPDLRAAVLELLLRAVACSARFDQVPELTANLEALGDHDVPTPRRAGLYAQLVSLTVLAGRPADALWHVDVARRLLGDSPAEAHAAPVDLAAAYAETSRLAPDRLHTATELARRAVDAAQRAGLSNIACEALMVLGYLTWRQDEAAATECFIRARALAEADERPILRVAAEVYLARIAARRDGRMDAVEQAQQEALRIGVLPLTYETDCLLALDEIRRCQFAAAGTRIREGLTDATRLRLGRSLSMLRLVEAIWYAHQARRAEMQESLERLAPFMDDVPGLRQRSYGMARAFCSLLEEDRDAAEQEFAQALAYDTENPVSGGFGRYGIILLLGVLAGRMGWQHHLGATQVSGSATRWNRQFVGLAHAVLLGREGRSDEATAAATAALEAAEIYPMTRNLCLRLVAGSAHEDGWGEPVEWLRQAEEYFHGAGIPAVAGACRSLLRGMGASIRQRRTGTERVPPDLRRHGVTVREFEVARLLAERIRYKDIAGRLHISPRTVEKHVASLLQKTGHRDRAAFVAAARQATQHLTGM